MIKQKAKGLNSRSEANPYDENKMLPLITAPMTSVVDENNYDLFIKNKIQVCLPRGIKGHPNDVPTILPSTYDQVVFESFSLDSFIKSFVITNHGLRINAITSVCIDTANGNMPKLHDAIRKAKKLYSNNLIIMAGNVSSVEAFIELAKTGVDYIRVGVGGGGCNTTSNTGVGQEDLEKLIKECRKTKLNCKYIHLYEDHIQNNEITELELNNIANVKIIADGISTYIKQCEKKYGFNDNGYAAINKLLYAGADLVMIGKLFAQSLESAGTKVISNGKKLYVKAKPDITIQQALERKVQVEYAGMSTHKEQHNYNKDVKPSEGNVKLLPVRWTLDQWLFGDETQDYYPYLSGWVNTIKSAMSYTGNKNINEFHE